MTCLQKLTMKNSTLNTSMSIETELRLSIADEIVSRAMENLIKLDSVDKDERYKIECMCDGLMLAASIVRGIHPSRSQGI